MPEKRKNDALISLMLKNVSEARLSWSSCCNSLFSKSMIWVTTESLCKWR